jgi:hypothetical protein
LLLWNGLTISQSVACPRFLVDRFESLNANVLSIWMCHDNVYNKRRLTSLMEVVPARKAALTKSNDKLEILPIISMHFGIGEAFI